MGFGGDVRIRTGDEGFAGLCLTTWPRRHHWCANAPAMVKKPTDGPCHRSASTVDGADNGVRTRDPHLGKVVLYQLSHVRVARRYISGSDRDAQGCFWNFSPRGRLEIFRNRVLPPEGVLVEYPLADAEMRRSPQRGRLAQGESTTLTR